jgi:hypothetical protein
MLRIVARGAGRYAATPESFWGATARGDLLARMALAAIREAGAAPTSLHASFLSLTLHDFALWIHRPARWDDFWLVTTRSDVGVAGRCFSRREVTTREGERVASAAWELSAIPQRT